LKKFITLY